MLVYNLSVLFFIFPTSLSSRRLRSETENTAQTDADTLRAKGLAYLKARGVDLGSEVAESDERGSEQAESDEMRRHNNFL